MSLRRKTTSKKELRLLGSSISEGIALGTLIALPDADEMPLPEFSLSDGEEEEHLKRFEDALSQSKRDLNQLHENLRYAGHEDAANIIHAHIQMLDDPMIEEEVKNRLLATNKNIEVVFDSVMEDIVHKIVKHKSSFFRDRAVDVQDLSKRVMNHLRKKTGEKSQAIPPQSILVVKQLKPSDVASMKGIAGVIAEKGSGSCHAALIARSKGIPYITRLDHQTLASFIGRKAIIDGNKGEVIVDPSDTTVTALRTSRAFSQSIRISKKTSTQTCDGAIICLLANISQEDEIKVLAGCPVDGVGLYRSEFLFLRRPEYLHSEELQYHHYRLLLQQAGGKPVIVRVMDVGGDKDPSFFLNYTNLYNPPTLRGIRFLLANREIFKIQLKALLRAASHGDLKILLPFVSDLQEVLDTKELIKKAKDELANTPHAEKIELGVMIEIPAAVMIADLLAKECDFLSLGTNDLLHFTSGIDRTDTCASEQIFSLPLSLIRMIAEVAKKAKEANIRLSLCGEIASNPSLVSLLIGLGISELSCSVRYVSTVQDAIHKLAYKDCCKLAETVLGLSTTEEIRQQVQDFLKAHES